MAKNFSSGPENLFTRQRPLTVSEISEQIRKKLERDFPRVLVEGEVSNFKANPAGHWYFSLKDKEAQLKVACYRNTIRLMRFEPQNGMTLIVRGRIGLYLPQGQHQLIVEWMEPAGVGALHLAFEQQKERLQREGLFDKERKRPLPIFPRRVGVVTSSAGAALHDILRVLERRSPGLDVVIAPVRVQGTGAAAEIAAGIDSLNRLAAERPDYPIDVLIVGRGGGSMEDLWAFNDELVARAIHRSRIPVVSAVGHETDTTIADFVADVRAATPSVAAEQVSANTADLLQHLDEIEVKLTRHLRYSLLRYSKRVDDLIRRPSFDAVAKRPSLLRQRVEMRTVRLAELVRASVRHLTRRVAAATRITNTADPRKQLAARRARLQLLEDRLSRAMENMTAGRRADFTFQSGRLGALSPLNVLARGYALARGEAGRLITRADNVRVGEDLRLTFADGIVACRVISKPGEQG